MAWSHEPSRCSARLLGSNGNQTQDTTSREESVGCGSLPDRQTWMLLLQSGPSNAMNFLTKNEKQKLKARFLFRGDQQIEGVDYFESPSGLLDYDSTVTDIVSCCVETYMCALLQAYEDVYVEMPRRFCERGKVLKLKRSFYSLKQSPEILWTLLRKTCKISFPLRSLYVCPW